MNKQTEPMGALAVMDALVAEAQAPCIGPYPDDVLQLMQARAAIAELIECNRDALAQLAFILADHQLSAERANSANRTIHRIEAALARVGGAL